MKIDVRTCARSAMVAALYVTLTLALRAISFGPVQFRVAEALTLLPAFTSCAVPGLFAGCLLGNLLGGAVWYDVVLGALATLAAAILTRALRSRPILAALPPVIMNGAVIGPVVYLAYVKMPGEAVSWSALALSAGTVALGEAAVCFTLGLALLYALRRLPDSVKGRLGA